jgi:hypothetical protein
MEWAMKRIMIVLVLVLGVSFAGCITKTVEHERYLNSLINRPIKAVIFEWGSPHRIIYGPTEGIRENTSLYVWDSVRKGKIIGHKMLWVDSNGNIYKSYIGGEQWLDPGDVSSTDPVEDKE